MPNPVRRTGRASPAQLRLALVTLLTAGLGALVVLVPVPVGAQARTSAELRAEVAELTHEERRLLDALQHAGAEANRLREDVAALERRIAAVEIELADAQARLEDATAVQMAAAQRLRSLRAEQADAEATLVEQAVSEYMLGGAGLAHANLLLNAGDAHRLQTARLTVETVLDHQDAIVRRVQALADEADRLHAASETARAGAATARNVIGDQRAALVTERDAANGLRAQAEAAGRAHEAVLAQVRERREAHEMALNALRQASSSLAVDLASRQAGHVPPAPLRGRLALPVLATRTSSGFGMRIHPIFGTERLHAGIDFAAPAGTPVYAADEGEVVIAGERGGYGLTVVVDHGEGLATLSAHLGTLLVEPGQVVDRGELIGLVGSTGSSTGPHLHFEVRILGTPVDPGHYL